MKKNSTKIFIVGSLILVAGTVGFSSVASAKSLNATTRVKTMHTVKVKETKMHNRTPLRGNMQNRVLPGKVVSVSDTELVMTSGNKTYTIPLSGTTPVVDRMGAKIALTDIATGHRVSVRGTVTGTTVTNVVRVRDSTLPLRTGTLAK